jgi:hypothetical protein
MLIQKSTIDLNVLGKLLSVYFSIAKNNVRQIKVPKYYYIFFPPLVVNNNVIATTKTNAPNIPSAI